VWVKCGCLSTSSSAFYPLQHAHVCILPPANWDRSSSGYSSALRLGPPELYDGCRLHFYLCLCIRKRVTTAEAGNSPILAEIFRQSLRDGVIPSIWKNADVAPVFKKGGRDTAENYRPISLTCVCCKILEHIISSHIGHHLDQYGILSPYQHGFRKLHILVKPNYLSLFRIFFFIKINMYLLIWLYWISPKLLMLFHTDVCWGSSAYTA